MASKRPHNGKASSGRHRDPGAPQSTTLTFRTASVPTSSVLGFTERLEYTTKALRDMEINTTSRSKAQDVETEDFRHEWYQNSTHVIALLTKGVPKDKAQIDIQPRSLRISISLQSRSTFRFKIDHLFWQVNTEKSVIRVLPAKIEIILAKAVSGHKWNALECNESVAANPN